MPSDSAVALGLIWLALETLHLAVFYVGLIVVIHQSIDYYYVKFKGHHVLEEGPPKDNLPKE